MVSEFNHRYQLADNFCIDAQATKFCLNYRLKQTEERKISGYVQTISQDPFGVVLTSDIQVKIKVINMIFWLFNENILYIFFCIRMKFYLNNNLNKYF